MKELTDNEFVRIRDYIKQNYGINLGPEKRTHIYSRLRTVASQKGFDNFTDYFDYLLKDKSGESIIQFINKITTNHTFFMREADHFYYFRDTVLPYIEQEHKATKDLRVWCAGCSSGEEPYTLQMIIHEHFKGKPDWKKDLLATDISSNVLEKAVNGLYSNESISVLPKEWQQKFITKYDNDNSIMSEDLKKDIIFRKFNLMDDNFNFKKPLQVIFCRNVMIYFDNPTRKVLVKKFYDCLEPGGYFFIGHSESLNQINNDFKYIMPAIYRKI